MGKDENANQNQDNIKKAIRQNAQKLEIPDSIKPDVIEHILHRHAQKPQKKVSFVRIAKVGIGAMVAAAIGTTAIFALSRNIPVKVGKVPVYTEIEQEEDGIIASARDYAQVYGMFYQEVEAEKKGILGILGAYDAEESTMADNDTGYSSIEAEGTARNEAFSSYSQELADTTASSKTAAADTNNSEAASGEEAYSKTNNQVAEVEEGDIVKTDGRYIYRLLQERRKVVIVEADGADMNKVGEIILDEDCYASEMYLQDTTITVVQTRYESTNSNGGVDGQLYQEDIAYSSQYYGGLMNQKTEIVTYDISDKGKVKNVGSVTVAGNCQSSRVSDGYLYAFVSFVPYTGAQEEDVEAYIPTVNESCIAPGNIYLPETRQANRYLVAVSIDLNQPSEVVEEKAIMMYGELFYVSAKNIYIAETVWQNVYATDEGGNQAGDSAVWQETSNTTNLARFSYEEGIITPAATGTVKGTLNDQFSMDEFQDHLRLVSTITSDNMTYTTSNSLYILDASLTVVGSVENLAPDESIYSARFMGNIGYFVTYRQVDPLFSVDLSDVTNPVVLGELKISGFSEYLHFYGENLLLGMGWETDMSSRRLGMKLSMFDISNPTDVQEKDKLVLEGVQYCQGLYDHKAICINTQKNIIGFMVTRNQGLYTYDTEYWYYTYTYDEANGFVKTTETKISRFEEEVRGVFIGNTLYVIDNRAIRAIQLENGEKVGEISLT